VSIISIPQLVVDASGQLLISLDGATIDHRTLAWSQSRDNGETWVEHSLLDGMFSPESAQPDTL